MPPTASSTPVPLGGFAQDLRIGDVVIASEMRFHDVDVTAFGYEMGQMAQQPAAFPCDDKLIALAPVLHR